MAAFIYEAKNLKGELIKGKMESLDLNSVTASLRQNGLYPITIKAESKGGLNIDLGQFQGVSIKDVSIFCRQFSFIVTAGISILRAIEIVRDQTENKRLKKVLEVVYEDVQKGRGLSEAMNEHREIPTMLVNMIAVGEASGNLDKVMLRMAEYYDKEYKQKQKVKSALTYPIVVCIFALIVVLFLVIKVLPTFIGMINSTGGGTLPLPTRIVLAFSNFITTKWEILVAIVLAIIIIPKFTKNSRSDGSKVFDKLKLKMPVFGKINTKIVSAEFARTFSTLMSSGVSLIQSMDICKSIIANTVIKDVLEDSKEQIKRGGTLGETLERKAVFPPMLTQMIKIGEESGTLDSVLEKTAEFYDGEVETATTQLTTMLEPIIIILLAVVVGFIVLSIIMPMFQMYNNLNENSGMIVPQVLRFFA